MFELNAPWWELPLRGRDGEIFPDVFKRCRVPTSDFDQALREADCDLKDMKSAFLEADGKISVLKSASKEGASREGAS